MYAFHVVGKVIPNYRNWDFYEYNAPLAVFGMPRKKLDEILEHFSRNIPRRITEDQPGMSAWYFVGLHLFRKYPEVFADSAENVNLEHAQYDPEKREADFEFHFTDRGELKIYTAFYPEKIVLNNKEVNPAAVLKNGLVTISGGNGKQHLKITLSNKPNSFRHPIIKNLL